jgi:acyl-CoA thioesterase-1
VFFSTVTQFSRGWVVCLGLVLSLWSMAMSSSAQAQVIQSYASPLASDARVLVFGDSLSAAYGIEVSQGWVALLTEKAKTKAPEQVWLNASLSGETTGGGRAKLAGLLKRFQPTDVLLELGANDFLRGYPLALAERNLRAMIDQIQQSGARAWLMGIQLPPNYGVDYNLKISELYQAIAKDSSLAYLPFFLAPLINKPELIQADGLHPNAQAQPLIASQMASWLGLQP